MFSRIILSSVLLAALSNGLAIRRDTDSNLVVLSLPTATPQPTSLPVPSISLSLPPLGQSSTVIPTQTLPSSSPLPSVVTTTVYVYPTQYSPTPSWGQPTAGPSSDPDDVINLPQDDSFTLPPPAQSTPITLPTGIHFFGVRQDNSVVSQLRDLQRVVVETWASTGRGDVIMAVVGQIESLITQAGVPGADDAAILGQAQSLVHN